MISQESVSAQVGDVTTASVFVMVLTRGPIPRAEIAQRLGLSAGTVSKAVKPLIQAGYLIEGSEAAARPGRPLVPLRVAAQREFVIGVKLTGDRIIGVAVDLLANVRATREAELADHDVEHVVGAVSSVVAGLRAALPQGAGAVTRVGVGLGGHVDAESGVVRYAPFLGWRDVPLGPLLDRATGLRVVVENDVNALTIAELWFGAGVDVRNFVVVTIGAGVGCGIVIDGALVHGAMGLAGELGHAPIEPDGPLCRCGNAGCIETIASEEAILRRIGEGRKREAAEADSGLDIGEAARLAREGDPVAADAFARAGDALGRGMAIVANLLNPHRIVLSGEGLAASDLFEKSARASFATHAFGRAADCEVVTRPLPDHVWARGAAAVAIQHLFQAPISGAGR